MLLLALGFICMQQELWGKARNYLEASLAIEPSHTAFVRLGQLLERMGEPEEASQHVSPRPGAGAHAAQGEHGRKEADQRLSIRDWCSLPELMPAEG